MTDQPRGPADTLWGISYGNARHIIQVGTEDGATRTAVGLCGQEVRWFSDDTTVNWNDFDRKGKPRTWGETVMRRKPCRRCEKKHQGSRT